jgi:hypothetical protein
VIPVCGVISVDKVSTIDVAASSDDGPGNKYVLYLMGRPNNESMTATLRPEMQCKGILLR